MKLAEALIERAELKGQLESLRMRMMNNARVQEGTEPLETPDKLLKELEEGLARMEYLMTHINKTNANTTSKEGLTISELIAKRDCLSKKVSLLGSYVDSASAISARLTHSEIKVLSAIPVSEMRTTIDKLSKELRLIDTKIQELNWLTELL